MKVRHTGCTARFDSIKCGEAFQYGTAALIKLQIPVSCNGILYNAVDLHDGEICAFDPCDLVSPMPNAAIVSEGE